MESGGAGLWIAGIGGNFPTNPDSVPVNGCPQSQEGVPVIGYKRAEAERAFEVHAALIKAEAGNRALKDNPVWTMLRQDAFERFSHAFWRDA